MRRMEITGQCAVVNRNWRAAFHHKTKIWKALEICC